MISYNFSIISGFELYSPYIEIAKLHGTGDGLRECYQAYCMIMVYGMRFT